MKYNQSGSFVSKKSNLKIKNLSNYIKQRTDLTQFFQLGIIAVPLASKTLLKFSKGGALLPPPLKIAVVAAPVGMKLAVYGYGLHKAFKAAKP